MLKPRVRPIVIALLLVFAAFSPSIFAELITIDDLDTYKWFQATHLTLHDLFLPASIGGSYYRPLIGVSYLFDKHVWLLDTRMMHLDNIFFHLLNAFLVYRLALRLLLPRREGTSNFAPLLAALLFGLHPVNTESVDWISGRTDVMACASVLASALLLLRYRERREGRWIVAALAALVPGILVKETALAFVMGGMFILTAHESPPADDEVARRREMLTTAAFAALAAGALIVSYSMWSMVAVAGAYLLTITFLRRDSGAGRQYLHLILFCTAAGLAAWLFFLIRKVVFTSNIVSMSRTLKLIADDFNYACQTFLGASGFYVGKFFLPFPLNFAIREIDPLYNGAGAALVIFCLYLLRRRTLDSAIFLAGVCMFFPALPLSLGTVTWTAYAERYIYIATAFWSVSTVFLLQTAVSRFSVPGKTAAACAAVLVMAMFGATFARSVTWTSNLRLFSDTVAKSPVFKTIRNDYMAALIAAGDFKGAREQYRIAQKIPSIGYMEEFDLNLAVVAAREGKQGEATEQYEKAIRKKKGKSAGAWMLYLGYLKEGYADAVARKDEDDRRRIGGRMIEVQRALYGLNHNPDLLYQAGQLALALGERDTAKGLFREAASAFPARSPYAGFASRLAAKLSQPVSQGA